MRFKDNTYHFENSEGYHDEVRTSIIPWKLPVRYLTWGRIIHKDVDISYSLIRIRESGDYFAEAHARIGESCFYFKEVRIEVAKVSDYEPLGIRYPDEYDIYLKSGPIMIRISVFDHIKAIVNDFMDYREDYGRLITWILKKISRNPRGIKFFAKAAISIDGNGQHFLLNKIDMIDEFVMFGR